MPEPTPRWFNHFAFFSFAESFYTLLPSERRQNLSTWLNGLRSASPCVEVYQVYPAQANADILVWSAMEAEAAGGDSEEAADVTSAFFTHYAAATNPYRHILHPKTILWGYTQPSQYTKTRSNQEIDPFHSPRAPYLVVYPFVKTASWYLLSREDRQKMMSEHIRIGKRYPEIKQLLLYSFGVQDQEFVVVYETADLTSFSALVYELRGSEARLYTERDTPLYTAIYHPPEETLSLWLSTPQGASVVR
jgi:chlorite dismutase